MLSLEPKYPDAHYNRGTALLGLGRLAEAIVSFDRVIALDPQHVGALVDRGTTFHQLGRFKWERLGMEYRLKDATPPTPETVARVVERFQTAGLNAV